MSPAPWIFSEKLSLTPVKVCVPCKMTDTDTKNSGSMHLKPRFDDFLVGDDDYEVFRERVELFFDCNCVPEVRQPILFLSCISPCVYKLIKDRVAPAKPSSKSMSELYDLLDKHYVVKRNKRAERCKFTKVVQQVGESLAEFLARIREAGSKCEFGSFVQKFNLSDNITAKIKTAILEDCIVDRFVMGVRNAKIQQALLEDNPESLEVAYEKAKTMQMAMEENNADKEVNIVGGRSGRQHQQKQQQKQQKQQHQPRQRYRSNHRQCQRGSSRDQRSSSNRRGEDLCGRCGRAPHDLSECPAREIVCHRCKRKGHFVRWCRNDKVEVNN